MRTLYRTGIRTVEGAGELRIIDQEEGSGTPIEGAADLPITIEQGDGASSVDPYDVYTYGSFVDLTLSDEGGELFERFERFFDETRYDVVLELPGFGTWRGKIRNDLVEGPTSRRTRARTIQLTAYDRLGYLKEADPVPVRGRPLTDVLADLFWTANEEVPIFAAVDAQLEDFSGATHSIEEMVAYHREATGYPQNVEEGEDIVTIEADNARQQLDELAKSLQANAFYDSKSEQWCFLHVSLIGKNVTGQRTDALGLGNQDFTSATLEANTLTASGEDIDDETRVVVPVRPLDEYRLTPKNFRGIAWETIQDDNGDYVFENRDQDPVIGGDTGGLARDPHCTWNEAGQEPVFWESIGAGGAVIDDPQNNPRGVLLPSGGDQIRNEFRAPIRTDDIVFIRTQIWFEPEGNDSIDSKIVINYQDGTTDDKGLFPAATSGIPTDYQVADGKVIDTIELHAQGADARVIYFTCWFRTADLQTTITSPGTNFPIYADAEVVSTYSLYRNAEGPVRRTAEDPELAFLIRKRSDSGSDEVEPPAAIQSRRLSPPFDRMSLYRADERFDREGEGLYRASPTIFGAPTLGTAITAEDLPQGLQGELIPAGSRRVTVNESGVYRTELDDVERRV